MLFCCYYFVVVVAQSGIPHTTYIANPSPLTLYSCFTHLCVFILSDIQQKRTFYFNQWIKWPQKVKKMLAPSKGGNWQFPIDGDYSGPSSKPLLLTPPSNTASNTPLKPLKSLKFKSKSKSLKIQNSKRSVLK